MYITLESDYAVRIVAELSECFCLYLADTLTCNVKALTHLFKGA